MAPDRDELDALAGEYVLGTLSADERGAAEARYAADADFRRLVSDWEKRLQPLADSAGDLPLPASVFEAIDARIGAAAAPAPASDGGNVVALRREVGRWRLTALVAGAAAAVLAAVVVVEQVRPPSAQQSEFVAILTSEGASPAFVATVNVEKGTISVRQVVPAPPEDKSYELWAVEPDAQPVSLGVFDDGANLSRALDHAPEGLTLAISLEPKGGSPTGVATGPVVFSGQLVPAE
ncbi:MAG: anti-sigma factor [Bauldia sp.]|uniref:anti-sigma factor n=1 Tax=Bauldia sp. TaxID=2575872 RepID=UPI001DC7AB33|nr:anti-sigma factor [Bauldia sp.]MCB1490023.1 anti-sigma factor [Bauldia sp.]MCB1497919.1 anti-sigma factor [Bauldia sp.]